MGLGQTMLTVLAMGMLATVMLTVNTNNTDSNTAVQMSQYRIMAASLATSTLERATGLAFDENSVNAPIPDETYLTTNLGRETGEVDSLENTFDDFDDYNGFHKWVKADTVFFRSADFRVWSSVDYVTIVGNDVVTSPMNARTFSKRITVYVSSPYMNDTLRYSTIYSYWFFR
ncbi:MAG TPA: hypothetical protein VMF59_16630 [Bacteroidota bacterium]|nr:hypothetical protein [Bacteroidota bacterium]